MNPSPEHPHQPPIPEIPQPLPLPQPVSQPQPPQRRLPAWRFWTPLVIQMALLVSVPAQSAYTYVTGETVVLQTAPVDPYSFLRGYYQTLSYQISNPTTLRQLPGGEAVFGKDEATPPQGRETFYVVLQAPEEEIAANTSRPNPWQAVRISLERPTDLAPRQVALEGQITLGGQVRYGLESYYMPESQREDINQSINTIQGQNPEAFVVEIKVDRQGNAIPISLWVQDQNYRF